MMLLPILSRIYLYSEARVRCAEPRSIVNYPQSHLVLAGISSSLPPEVSIGGVALHEIAPRSTRRADDNFLLLEGGFEGRMKLFYKNPGLKRFKVDAVGKEACFATTQSAIQIRHRRGDANVIIRQSGT
jgi:hypothetical protein